MTLPKTSIPDCSDPASAPDAQPVSPAAPRLRFVLVETSRPGNIGAVARAMKTMGYDDLVLVNPRFPDAVHQAEAVAFASGAQDVLQGARIVDSIDAALEGCNLAAAVSARLREFSPPVVTPRVLAEQLAARSEGQAALVFGNERFGLPNEIVAKCNLLINIPANPTYSSLNLAQAVQVVAYECRVAAQAVSTASAAEGEVAAAASGPIGFRGDAAGIAQIEAMFVHLEEALVAIDFLEPANPRKLMARLRRLFARAGLENEEVNILRGIARQILRVKKG